MTPKHIHFFVISLNVKTGGGSHFNALNYIRFLKNSGFLVTVHTLRKGVNEVPDDVVVVEHDIGENSFSNNNTAVTNLLNTYEPEADLFFLYGVDMTWGAGKYRKGGGKVPVTVYLDNYLSSMGLAQWMGYYYFIKRWLWDSYIGLRLTKYVDKFCTVSPFVMDRFCSFGFPRDAFVILPNFFEHKKTFHEEEAVSGSVSLLYTGRLIHDKGIDLLLKVCAELPATLDWKLHIVGNGPLEKSMHNYVAERNMKAKVTFTPWLSQEQLPLVYQDADVFVHPARWPEPFGRTIIEAMQAGLPVIVPREGGSSWIVGNAGLTFENGSKESLHKAVYTLLCDSALRKALSVRSKERLKDFSEEVVGPYFVKIVNELIEKR